MTTLTPDEVRRLALQFSAKTSPVQIGAPKPAKKRHIPLRIHSSTTAIKQATEEAARIAPILASIWGVAPDLVLCNGRKQQSIYARLMAYAWLRKEGYSLPLIARATHHVDHGTICLGLRRYQSHMDAMPAFASAWDRFVEAANQ